MISPGSDDAAKIFVDDSVPATLHYSGKSVPCLTLQEAVIAWGALADEIKKDASIKVDEKDGPNYHGWEIDRLWRRYR